MIPFRDRNPSGTVPFVTIALILVNVLVFLLELSQLSAARGPSWFREEPGFFEQYGLTPLNVTLALRGRPILPGYTLPMWLTFFTSMFLHGGWMHLIGNMWYLWIFGDNVEDRMGHVKFLVFYVACGLGAGAIHVAFNATSAVPTVGASGAIAGVLGAYLLAFPRAGVLTLLPLGFLWTVVELPAFVVLGFWFVIQYVSGLRSLTMMNLGGVAWWAHVGGFVLGLLLLPLLQKRRERRRVYIGRRYSR